MTEAFENSPVVALLGTGTMGLGMGRNIAAAGLTLRAWNRTQAKADPLTQDGATVLASAAEAVSGADIVVTMLFDADSVAAAIDQAAPSLTPGTIWIQTSTVGVEGDARLAALAGQHGLVYVDAPVLGTKGPAEAGTLTVLASGPESAKPRVAPVLDAIGSRTLWVGEAGAGTRLKLVANGWVLTVVDGLAQSLRTAEAFGLDPALFLDAVKGGAVDAPYLGIKGNAMLNGSYDPAFTLSGAVKDATLIEEGARAAGADPAFVAIAREHLLRAEQAGHGDKDMSAVYLGY
ncbi:NAD(P)-dependent oxidoreductase [Kineosporia sp. J2-2]|uniref:NAD(P)-dependent oxidoreductase n=1 Tax=Kineosporia corallincola TaxID=2835133 RepID=A0ABS5T9E5_9ACTN|nr:NAD(P)-dependent oxidoreductase [Kineosporia corallincola]MBT0767691.1 NAD(P)-dependent oxidoreductase [Kineosporia corallincola]